jgi:4-hydroxybenzoate polyprenyltransferase
MALMLLLLLFIGEGQLFGWSWYCAVAVVALLFTWQLWLARRRERDGCFRAFRNNIWVGLVIFLGLAGNYLL